MNENRPSGVRAVICVQKSLAVSVAASLFFLTIFAFGLCSAPDPKKLALPLGLCALYAGSFAGGVACGKFLRPGPLSGAISGAIYCAIVFVQGLGAGFGDRPVRVTALLLLGIVAAGAAGAYLTQNRKSRRRGAGKAGERARKARRSAMRRRA